MQYTSMDFCAGIGCGRLGLQKAGFDCVAFSEINHVAEKTYRMFWGYDEKNFGDLMTIDTKLLPDFDLLIAGFPCQTFSVIGQRKGMDDPRGQVIFGIAKILQEKNIKYFILENVKGLVNHENGKTIQDIMNHLDNIGYYVSWKVLNTIDYGLPQSRERVYFVGIRKDLKPFAGKFIFPEKMPRVGLDIYLIETSDIYIIGGTKLQTLERYLKNKYNNGKYTLTDLLEKKGYIIDTRQSDIRFYKDFSPTLRTGRHGLLYVKDDCLRELSGLESLLLQGIDYEIAIKASSVGDKDLLSQSGNAMSVTVIEAIGKNFLSFIRANE